MAIKNTYGYIKRGISNLEKLITSIGKCIKNIGKYFSIFMNRRTKTPMPAILGKFMANVEVAWIHLGVALKTALVFYN